MKIKNVSSNFITQSAFVKLKNSDWLERQRVAGKIVAKTLSMLEKLVSEGTNKSLLELDKLGDEFIRDSGCIPTFFQYKGFPNSVCISVNRQLVHGVATDYKLKDGDVISFDLGATYNGAIADSALTCIWGEPKSKGHVELIAATKEALVRGIGAVKVGNRIGAIGDAIYRYSKDKGFKVIETYGGHGLEENIPHAQPFVSNKSDPSKGIKIQPGLTIAIEPMLLPYSSQLTTKTGSDGWTVYTEEIGAHEEHTLFVKEDGVVEIITERNNIG